MNISPQSHKIFINDTSFCLSPSKLAVYAMILHTSTLGKCNGIPVSPTKEDAVWIERMYRKVYAFLKGDEEADVKSPIRRLSVTISEINKELSESFVGLSGLLKIGKDKKHYSVPLKAEDITIDRVPMLEHQVWIEL